MLTILPGCGGIWKPGSKLWLQSRGSFEVEFVTLVMLIQSRLFKPNVDA